MIFKIQACRNYKSLNKLFDFVNHTDFSMQIAIQARKRTPSSPAGMPGRHEII
jgi:hypothetical protein